MTGLLAKGGAPRFCAMLVEIAGVTANEAETVYRFYLREKLAKHDRLGQVQVRDGGLLDAAVIRRALAMAEAGR